MKHTKIVCTIGPSSESPTRLQQMMRAGMNVARLNFSHGTYAEHARLIRSIRAAARAVGMPIAIMQDIQGPRIRLGALADSVTLKKKAKVALVSQGDFDARIFKSALPLQYYYLHRYVKRGSRVLIKDGTIELSVERVDGSAIHCVVVQGGVVKSHQGVNVPDVSIGAGVLTAKDKRDIAFGVSKGVDYIAMSFVRDARDVRALRRLLSAQGERGVGINIIAKIERREAIENLDAIIAAADAIMVARGDLGVEVGTAQVPLLQKDIITRCVAAGKPVIVATHMLESMVTQPRPTRAEAADVANAIIDHTDAVMLSAESATGAFPVQAVKTMTDIALTVEASRYDDPQLAMAQARFGATEIDPQAGTIAVYARSLGDVTRLSSERPQNQQLIAFTSNPQLLRQLSLVWGVQVYRMAKPKTEQQFEQKVKRMKIPNLQQPIEYLF